ncbi:MAG: hypothetical protein ONB30_11810 [candidate division KSB1 bacterium]|nr:hypothetical protein [candidate division KSB1 bacterium]
MRTKKYAAAAAVVLFAVVTGSTLKWDAPSTAASVERYTGVPTLLSTGTSAST